MPASRSLVPLFAAGIAATGCRDGRPDPASWTAEPVRQRLVEQDGRLRFDAEATPRFRVGADAPTDFEVRFIGPEGVVELWSETERRGDGAIVSAWLRDGVRVWGPGDLCLAADELGHCVPARWSPTPTAELAEAGLAELDPAALSARLAALDGPLRLWARHHLARALRRAGRTDDAVAAWKAAAEDARALTLPRQIARSLRAAAFLESVRGRLTAADALLTEADAALTGLAAPVDRVRLRYYRAVADHALSRYREATHALESIVDDAWALGADHTFAAALDMLAVALVDQGRSAEARAVIGDPRLDALVQGRGAVDRAAFYNNRAWIGLLAASDRQSTPTELEAIAADLDRAIELGGDSRIAHDARVNRAALNLRAGALDAAERTIGQVPPSAGHVTAELLRGEIALRRGVGPAAAQAFDRALTLADAQSAGLPTDDRWRARHGQGRVAVLQGDTAAARAHFATALDLLDRVAAQAGVWHARARFYADRRPLVDDTVTLLLAEGDPAGAFAVLDRSNARALRALEARTRLDRLPADVRTAWEGHRSRFAAARQAWDAAREDGDLLDGAEKAAWVTAQARRQREMVAAFEAAEALLAREAPSRTRSADAGRLTAALAPGAALVAFARVADRIHAFWLERDQPVRHAVLSGEGAATLLDPFVDRLGTIEHLYVVPGDVPAAHDLGTVDRPEGPLAARISLSVLPYAGALLRPRRTASGPTLVVADPTADLPHARKEGEAVAKGTPGSKLLMRRAATRNAVREAMAGAAAMHYAGHGIARAETPWQAHLALADDTTLTVADILTVPVPAGTVVLSGCKTGVQGALSDREALGLADAFVAAGSRAVLATRRNIPDEAAARFIARFHAEGGLDQPGRALQITVAAFRAAGDPIWSAFRLTGHP